MANQWQININPNPAGPARVKFDPDPRKANPLDQIFWTNNDTVAHWPGLKNADGSINATFFMPNQIAPNGDVSPSFSPAQAFIYTYACSLPGHGNETGTIQITNP
jgi:plastocyanin